MPLGAYVIWAVTGLIGFTYGIVFLYRVEKSGVKRWGAAGSVFKLGSPPNTTDDIRK